MHKQMIIPDTLCERVKAEASLQDLNFTQYTIRALKLTLAQDELLRCQPQIEKQLNDLKESLIVLQKSQKDLENKG